MGRRLFASFQRDERGIFLREPLIIFAPIAISTPTMQSWHHRGNDMGECNDLRKNHR